MKKKAFFALIVALVVAIFASLFAACAVETGVKVTGVKLSGTVLTLEEGKTAELTALVEPADATNKAVRWSSDNESVATVSEGVVTGVKAGSANVTVKTVNGGFTATCAVTVTAAGTGNPPSATDPVPVTGVLISGEFLPLLEGDVRQLTATVLPANATNQKVEWTSNDENVATVDDEGYVTAKGVGTANIKVTTVDGGFYKTCAVTVSSNAGAKPVTSVVLSPAELPLKVGANRQITATINPSNATNKTLTWKSDKENIATVEQDGTVTAVAPGTATITATAHNGTKGTCTVTVSNNAKTKYEVKFYSEGKLLAEETQQVEEGEKVVEPKGITREGYTLEYWAVGSEEGAEYKFDEPVEGPLSLYAVWTDDNQGGAVKPPEIPAGSPITYTYAGNECAAFEWTDGNAVVVDASKNVTVNASVQYKKHKDSSYISVDKELIRQISGTTARVDIVGLQGGANYDFKITDSSNKTYTLEDVTIYAHDRSGYAHFNYSGVGAYNNDGTLKSNARVVYITDATKNSSIKVGGTTYSGLVDLLKNAAKYSKVTDNVTPLVVRIIGTINAATWTHIEEYKGEGVSITPDMVKGNNSKTTKNILDYFNVDRGTYNEEKKKFTGGTSKDITQQQLIDAGFNTLNTSNGITELIGLNSKMKYDASKDEFDSCWNDCNIEKVKNVTVEGIGEDAGIFQWGFTWKNCASIEVRNLTFDDYTEDACSFEGGDTSAASLSAFNYSNFWIHHNTFEEGHNYWDVCNEQDKHDGDGSTDFKGLKNVTISYNVYNGTHKTGLVGGGNTQTTANVTFHHNFYNGCKARLPLARQANMHMYNNYYKGTTSCDLSLRAKAYAFVENCYFESGNNKPVELQYDSDNEWSASAKLIGCVINESKIDVQKNVPSTNLSVNVGRTATITTENVFTGKKDFANDSSLFYYDSETKESKVSFMFTAEETKKYVPKLAGVQMHGGAVRIDGITDDDNTGGGNQGDDTQGAKTIVFDPSSLTGGDITDSKTVTVDGMSFKIVGNSSNVITVSSGNTSFSYNGTDYNTTKYMYLSGTAKFGSDGYRYVEFTTTAACKVTIVSRSSGTAARTINLVNTNDTGSILKTFNAAENSKNPSVITEQLSAAGTYRIGSAGSGINVYAIIIEYTA